MEPKNEMSSPMGELAIVIPAYNEEAGIAATIRDFYGECPQAFICVVNNNSSDATERVARETMSELGCRGVVLNEYVQGKAAAVNRAFRDISADIYVMVDADCTYPASDLPALLQPVLERGADMVIGDRLADDRYTKENKRPFHDAGNKLVKKLINTMFHAEMKDILSGYRVFNRRFVKNYPILSQGFALETEMTVHALHMGFNVASVPVHYADRPVGSYSKLNTFRDGYRILKLLADIFRLYRPIFFFSLVSALFAFLGLMFGCVPVIEFMQTGLVTHLPLAVLASGLMTLAVISLSCGLILSGISHNSLLSFRHRLALYDDQHSSPSSRA